MGEICRDSRKRGASLADSAVLREEFARFRDEEVQDHSESRLMRPVVPLSEKFQNPKFYPFRCEANTSFANLLPMTNGETTMSEPPTSGTACLWTRW